MDRPSAGVLDLTTRPDLGGCEWLLTNALGGFALGCADAVPRRRYHALLVAAATPPVGRFVALAGVADSVTVLGGPAREERFDLADADFPGRPALRAPDECTHEPGRVGWRWVTPAGSIRRTLELADGRNACVLTYERDLDRPARLELRPLVALRDFHQLLHEHEGPPALIADAPDACTLRRGAWTLRLRCPGATFTPAPDWWRNFEYAFDRDRGQDFREDLFCPGVFTLAWNHARPVRLEAWTDDGPPPPADLGASRRARLAATRDALAAHVAPAHRGVAGALAAAADQFVVRRDMPDGSPATSIIAGYPWFADWGRDTMIALRGLLLATGRVREATDVLRAFARLRRHGLLPNCFHDAHATPEYNTADASLWFVHAALDAREAGADRAVFAADLLPACVDILRAYARGTDHDIRVDPADGLVRAGSARTQLTWMDAARDGVIFTPRHGKPVEINALWVSALRRVERLCGNDGAEWRALADRAGASFERFWNPARSCLFDCLPDEGAPADEVRPNQVYAVSLPHSPLPPARARAVLACVRTHLLTPLGLRTLSRDHPNYRPRYEGTLFDRDGAYHNGTAWPFLLGAYAEGVLRVGNFSEAARREAFDVIAPLLTTLVSVPTTPRPLGTIAEIYDAERPQRPQGCPAQAWSVGELLRVLVLLGPSNNPGDALPRG